GGVVGGEGDAGRDVERRRLGEDAGRVGGHGDDLVADVDRHVGGLGQGLEAAGGRGLGPAGEGGGTAGVVAGHRIHVVVPVGDGRALAGGRAGAGAAGQANGGRAVGARRPGLAARGGVHGAGEEGVTRADGLAHRLTSGAEGGADGVGAG